MGAVVVPAYAMAGGRQETIMGDDFDIDVQVARFAFRLGWLDHLVAALHSDLADEVCDCQWCDAFRADHAEWL